MALVQLAVRDGDPAANMKRAAELIEAAPTAELYVLPELWTTGYAHDTWMEAALESTPIAIENLGRIARLTASTIAGSTVAVNEYGELVNRVSLIGPEGSIVATYDKVHLFAPMGEPRLMRAGTRRARCRIDPFTAALSICYDLRFPEMYRLDALDGADMFLIVAAWPQARVEVMRTLAAARAIENQAFVVLCNRAGVGAGGTEFGGASCILGPDGTTVACCAADETVLSGVLMTGALMSARGDSPILRQRSAGVDWPT